MTHGPRPYPADLMGSAIQPDCLADFTRSEIDEASEFLARMGYVERPKSRRP